MSDQPSADLREALLRPFEPSEVKWKAQTTSKDKKRALAVASVVPNGRARPPEERFWSKVLTTDGCWLWTAGKNQHGYGYFNRAGRPSWCVLAHRYSYEINVGPVPDGMCVLHRCDTPACVRPDHLFLGTRTDNANDKVAKGRQGGPKGEAHPKAYLTEADVLEALALFATGQFTRSHLARQFRCSLRNMRQILDRQTWRHI